MIVRYTAAALAEVAEIMSYIAANNPGIAANNPGAATGFAIRLERLLENVCEFPRMYRFSDEEGALVRIGRYPYLMFYAVDGDDVVVLHVRHGARRYPAEMRRSKRA